MFYVINPSGSSEGGYSVEADAQAHASSIGGTVSTQYPLGDAKAEKLAEIRQKANDIIVAKWPLWMQSNLALGLDTDPLLTQCKTDIANVRVESNTFEAAVSALTDIQSVLDYTYTFTAI